MSRRLIIIAVATLAIFMAALFIPTICQLPTKSAAYAQGSFGKKQKGDADEQRKQDEEKKAAEKKEAEKRDAERREQAKKDEAARRQITDEQQSDRRDSPAQPSHPTDQSTQTDDNQRVITDRTDQDTRDRNRTIDSGPAKRDRDSSDQRGDVYTRQDEREREREHRHRGTWYPYGHGHDPYIIIVTIPEDPWPSSSQPELTPRQVLDRICIAWKTNQPEWLVALLPDHDLKVFVDKEYSHKISAVEFYSRTVNAMSELETLDYSLDVYKKRWSKVIAHGVHRYKDIDGTIYNRKVAVTIEHENHNWVITETGYYTDPEIMIESVMPVLNDAAIYVMLQLTAVWLNYDLTDTFSIPSFAVADIVH